MPNDLSVCVSDCAIRHVQLVPPVERVYMVELGQIHSKDL